MPGLSEPGVGGVGDSYDNALAETVNGLYASNLRRSIFSARPRPRFTRTMAAGRRGRDVLEDHLAGGSAMPAVPIAARMLSGVLGLGGLDILCSTTPIRRAKATVARFLPRSFTRRCAQAFSQLGPVWFSITVAAW